MLSPLKLVKGTLFLSELKTKSFNLISLMATFRVDRVYWTDITDLQSINTVETQRPRGYGEGVIQS